MDFLDDFLVRDSLSDDGTRPSQGLPYASPDMICYRQITDPQNFFKSNYTQDPNIAVEIGQPNFFYVRGKNLGTNTLSRYMFVFWSTASLLMDPSKWINNKMKVLKGTQWVEYVEVLDVPPGGIGVGNDYFTWQPPTQEHTCLVGVASRTTIPEVPDHFDSNYTFVDWVRNTRSVCWRNLTLVNQYPDPQYVTLYQFGNLDNNNVPMFFKVQASDNIPAGTTIAATCDPLGIHAQTIIKADDPNSRKIFTGGDCPAKFKGTITVAAYLPKGATWPPNGQISTWAYISAQLNEPIAVYGAHPVRLGIPKEHLKDWGDGLLTELGNCSFRFI